MAESVQEKLRPLDAQTGAKHPESKPLDVAYAGHLNEWLRQQLHPGRAQQHPVETTPSSSIRDASYRVVASILSDEKGARTAVQQHLQELYAHCLRIYRDTDIPHQQRQRQFICQSGVVMSPDQCVTTILDDLRIRAFVRGIHRGLSNMQARLGKKIHLLYPACGPFAPLLLPLLSYYRDAGLWQADSLEVSLIDIQPGAVASLRAMVENLKLEDIVTDIQCMDACKYHPHKAVDMLVLEAMQHGFSREGQMAMLQHLRKFLAKDAVLIPQKVSIRAVITSGQREFVDQWENSDRVCGVDRDPAIQAERLDLGEIFALTPETLKALDEQIVPDLSNLLRCASVILPEIPASLAHPLLILCSQVTTYADEVLDEYDSGITHPLPDTQLCINFAPRDARPGDLLMQSGERVGFYYRLFGLPGFMAVREDA